MSTLFSGTSNAEMAGTAVFSGIDDSLVDSEGGLSGREASVDADDDDDDEADELSLEIPIVPSPCPCPSP